MKIEYSIRKLAVVMLLMCMSTASLCAFSGKLSPRSRCALSEEVTKSEDMKSCFIKISDENVIADLKRLGVKT